MSLCAFRYKLPLVAPIVLKGEMVSHREGILLNRDGRWAEAAPLPGFSRESLDDVIVELRSGNIKSPSLQFALSSLNPLDKIEQEPAELSVPVNALVQGSDEQIREQCERLVESNCTAVKLKVRDPSRDVGLVHRLRSELGVEVKIRLDANRSWNFNQAESFLENVRCSDIEYIEEPLVVPDRLEELYAKTNVPFALDETLAEKNVPIDDYPNAVSLIVKPTIIGDLERIEQFAATGKRLVFSAAYESGVGIARIARLAAQYSSDTPAGLDTYSRLGDDVLVNRLNMSNWTLCIPASPEVRIDKLEPIEL